MTALTLGDLRTAVALSGALEDLPDDTAVLLEVDGFDHHLPVAHIRSDDVDGLPLFVLSTLEHEEIDGE